MATQATPSPSVMKSLTWVAVERWLTPRSSNRDEAFRERSIRIAVALLFGIAIASFALSTFVFRDAWALVSIPTLHVVALGMCLLTARLVLRERIVEAGWSLVAIVCLGVSMLVFLARQDGNVVRQFSAMASFMIAPLLAALVLPRTNIMPVSLVTSGLYVLTQFLLPIDNFAAITGLDPVAAIGTGVVLLLLEGVTLRELRVEFDGRLAAMRDLLQQTETAKQQEEKARQRAETADKAKSQFLANMSHELRTPLNAIIGYDEAMLGGMVGTFTPDQTKLLGHIQSNSRRLLALINDILDLSKVEAGSLQVFAAPLSPHKVITETVENLRSLAFNKNIGLEVEISEAVPEVILSDVKKLQQIIVNLISNAIKFTNQGGVMVKVDTLDKHNWQIKVIDSGIGIPSEALTYIFEPFRQVDNSDTRKYKGTGLGLSITKRLVEILGGELTVESAVGRGSTFTVTMPRVNLPEAALEKAETK